MTVPDTNRFPSMNSSCVTHIVVFGATAGVWRTIDSGNDTINFALEYSLDGGTSFTRVSRLPSAYLLNRPGISANQIFNAASYLAVTVNNIPANTVVQFRVALVGTTAAQNQVSGGWGWGISVIEEKNVT